MAKITVVDERGGLLHTGYMDYPAARQAHAHEVDAGAIWDTAKTLLREAAATLVQPLETYTPRLPQHAAHRAQYTRYSKSYEAVRPLM